MATSRHTTRGTSVPAPVEPVQTVDAVASDVPGYTPPIGAEETPDGDGWLYTLQHTPEPLPAGVADMMAAPFRIRLPKTIYARHVRIASTLGEGSNAATGFYLLVAMSRVPAEWVDRLHAKDFEALSMMVGHISKNT